MQHKFIIISNVILEPFLRKFINDADLNFIDIICVSYNEFNSCTLDFMNVDAIVICLNFEEFYSNISIDVLSGKNTYKQIENDCISKCRNLYLYIKGHSKAPVIWFGYEDYYCIQSRNYGTLLQFEGLVDQLNLDLSDMIKEDLLVDFKRLIATVGIKNAYNIKGKYRWNAPYSNSLIKLMADEIYKQYLIAEGNTKKCLVLDCDNVLWGGDSCRRWNRGNKYW